jgi:protein-S-isoprenylcysteine O-methyltransferase Ste14
MEDSLFLVLASVCAGTHFVRTIYEILKHKSLITANKLSFVIVFSNMALLWVSWFMICISESNRTALPEFLNYFGIALIIAGGIVFFTGLFTIKTLESYKGDLITKGIYSKLRHPMYTGFILWICGGALIYGVITAIILAPLFIANVLYWRHLEELELEKRFADYSEYKKTTLF